MTTDRGVYGDDDVAWLPFVSLILFNISLALTPILHFMCSREMRIGLLVMLGGYSSLQEYEMGN